MSSSPSPSPSSLFVKCVEYKKIVLRFHDMQNDPADDDGDYDFVCACACACARVCMHGCHWKVDGSEYCVTRDSIECFKSVCILQPNPYTHWMLLFSLLYSFLSSFSVRRLTIARDANRLDACYCHCCALVFFIAIAISIAFSLMYGIKLLNQHTNGTQ